MKSSPSFTGVVLFIAVTLCETTTTAGAYSTDNNPTMATTTALPYTYNNPTMATTTARPYTYNNPTMATTTARPYTYTPSYTAPHYYTNTYLYTSQTPTRGDTYPGTFATYPINTTAGNSTDHPNAAGGAAAGNSNKNDADLRGDHVVHIVAIAAGTVVCLALIVAAAVVTMAYFKSRGGGGGRRFAAPNQIENGSEPCSVTASGPTRPHTAVEMAKPYDAVVHGVPVRHDDGDVVPMDDGEKPRNAATRAW